MTIDDEYERYHGLEEPYDPDEAYEAHQDGLTIEQLRASRDDSLFGLAKSISRLQGLTMARKQAE